MQVQPQKWQADLPALNAANIENDSSTIRAHSASITTFAHVLEGQFTSPYGSLKINVKNEPGSTFRFLHLLNCS